MFTTCLYLPNHRCEHLIIDVILATIGVKLEDVWTKTDKWCVNDKNGYKWSII